MNHITRISIAVTCALGVSAAFAQTVQRGEATVSGASKTTQTVAQASTTAPVRVAQAGGAATGATAGGATAGVGIGTTLVVVTAAIATIAIASDSGQAATQH
jgi:hypothetical protein